MNSWSLQCQLGRLTYHDSLMYTWPCKFRHIPNVLPRGPLRQPFLPVFRGIVSWIHPWQFSFTILVVVTGFCFRCMSVVYCLWSKQAHAYSMRWSHFHVGCMEIGFGWNCCSTKGFIITESVPVSGIRRRQGGCWCNCKISGYKWLRSASYLGFEAWKFSIKIYF